jgi:hypothetical protein
VVVALQIAGLEVVALVGIELLLELLEEAHLLKENYHYCQHSPTQSQ